MRSLPLAFICVLSCLAATASAHHGIPGYDLTQEVVVEGTVMKLDWKNPHVYFTVRTQGRDGKSGLVTIEGGTLSTMRAYGLTREQLAPGSHVTVRAHAKRAGLTGPLLGRYVTLRGGSVHNLVPGPGAQASRAIAPADGLAGKWAAGPNAVPEWMDASAQFPRVAGRRPPPDPTAEFQPPPGVDLCITEVYVPWQYVYGGLQTIEITGSQVILRAAPYGYLNERIVHLDQTTHPEGLAPSVLGHSIGHWEGQTLVVETVALRSPNPLQIESPRARQIERFSLTEDRRQLRYEITIEDPDLYTRPVTHSLLWDHRPDLDFNGDEGCDEAQARRFLQEDQSLQDQPRQLPAVWIALAAVGVVMGVAGYQKYRRRVA